MGYGVRAPLGVSGGYCIRCVCFGVMGRAWNHSCWGLLQMFPRALFAHAFIRPSRQTACNPPVGELLFLLG